MPSVKDFKKNHKNKSHVHEDKNHSSETTDTSGDENHGHKRRPGREKVEAASTPPPNEEPVVSVNEAGPENVSNVESDKKKVEISFFGSEIIRAKMPKPFEIAEAVATDWMNDGNFEDLQLGHPLAESAAIAGLKKAKELEKKVIDSGVIEKVAMQALTAGLKAQSEINNIRDQVKAKFGKK